MKIRIEIVSVVAVVGFLFSACSSSSTPPAANPDGGGGSSGGSSGSGSGGGSGSGSGGGSGSGSGSSSGGGSDSAFVGTWACSYSVDGGSTESQTLTITDNGGGSITVDSSYDGGPGYTCTGNLSQWVVSGTVASPSLPISCDGTTTGAITINSLTLTTNNGSLLWEENVTTSSDAGSSNITLAGQCTKG